MYRTIKRKRLLALMLTAVLSLSLCGTAFAAPMDDAKASLASVDITQTYNGKEIDSVTHDYTTQSSEVTIDYAATLQMTREMATYLCVRQSQLLDAKFTVTVNMEMDKLEFTETGEDLTVTFSSSFLKPVADGNFTHKFVKEDKGLFYYEISVSKSWAQANNSIEIPMELIVYYDTTAKIAYGYQDLFDADGHVKTAFANEKPMYSTFTEANWMQEIRVALVKTRVKDTTRNAVTSSTPITISARGTVDGTFTYEKWTKIKSFADYAYVVETNTDPAKVSVNTLDFGYGKEIPQWTSNVVSVRLIRSAPYVPPTVDPDDGPDSPYLNLEDHFAYVIGYPDGLVHPEGTITRAEVATIFFRMLTDEVRDEYWSKTNPYNDVKLTDWFNNAISTLTNLGILTGYPDGGFHPQANITRAEFATMAVRFFIITEDYTNYEGDAFSDIANHWANEYINIAYLLDIIDGYPDGTYRPQNAITRAEAMTIVNNTLRRSPCVPGIEPVEDHEDFISWPDNMNKKIWYYPAVQEATNSHDYVRTDDLEGKELWLDILPVRDWAAFERAWSDANSAANPGEVVDGK